MNKQFNFRYTAPTEDERREINSIRRQYSPQEKTESKLEKLRRLDALVKNTATVVAFVMGIVGCLIFGRGMSMILEWNIVLWGISVCIVGGVMMLIASPVYKAVLNKGKRKYGQQILSLSDELLNESTVKND